VTYLQFVVLVVVVVVVVVVVIIVIIVVVCSPWAKSVIEFIGLDCAMCIEKIAKCNSQANQGNCLGHDPHCPLLPQNTVLK